MFGCMRTSKGSQICPQFRILRRHLATCVGIFLRNSGVVVEAYRPFPPELIT